MSACSARCGFCGRCTARGESEGSGIPYVCLDCHWTGRGGVKATEHHRASRHHRIALKHGGHEVKFSCCADLAAHRTGSDAA